MEEQEVPKELHFIEADRWLLSVEFYRGRMPKPRAFESIVGTALPNFVNYYAFCYRRFHPICPPLVVVL